MSNRGSTSAFQTEIAKSANQPIHLVQIEWDSETVYMTDAYKSISWDGNDYDALSSFLAFSDIEETSNLTVSSVTMTLSGVDQTLISAFLNEDYLNRPVKIYLAFLDSSEAIISDPLLIFDGTLEGPVFQEDPGSNTMIIAAKASSHWADFERRSGRFTNHESQSLFYPGDKGLEYASEIVKDLAWGKEPKHQVFVFVEELIDSVN